MSMTKKEIKKQIADFRDIKHAHMMSHFLLDPKEVSGLIFAIIGFAISITAATHTVTIALGTLAAFFFGRAQTSWPSYRAQTFDLLSKYSPLNQAAYTKLLNELSDGINASELSTTARISDWIDSEQRAVTLLDEGQDPDRPYFAQLMQRKETSGVNLHK